MPAQIQPQEDFKEGADQLQVPKSSGEVPSERLKDATKARALAQRFIQDSAGRDDFFAMLNRQLDGNPPYDQTELERLGQSYRANFNTMEAQAYRDIAITPHYDIYSGGLLYFYIKYNARKLGVTTELADQYSKTASEIANRIVDEWYGFDSNNQPMINDKVWFGKGYWIWEDEKDWHYRHVPQHTVKIPNGASINLDELPIMVIIHQYQVHELMEKINQKSGEARGWKKRLVFEAIANASPKNPNNGASTSPDPIGSQQSLNDNDLYTGYFSDVVNCASIYVREFDGTITHGIVTLDQLRRDIAAGDNASYATKRANEASDPDRKYQDDWLFYKRGRYQNWRQVIAPFFLKNNAGSWNGSSGLGKDVYAMLQAKNRLECSVWDLAFLDTGIWLQAKTSRAMEEAAMVQAGAFNVIPPDFEAQQTQIRGNMEDPLAMLEHSDGLLQRNTGIYRQPFMDRQKGNPPTLGQVQLAYQDRTQLTNSMVSRSYRDYDKAYTELVRRLFMDEEFRKELKDAELPESALDHDNVESVKASRVIGNGSPQNRLFAIQQTGAVVSSLPEAGRVNWINDLIAASADRATVERWNPTPQSKTNNDHRRMAQIENATIKDGGAIDASDTDNDAIHLDTHIEAKSLALESLKIGANPLHVVDFVDRLGQHEIIHWQRLSQDKSRENQFKALAQTNAQLLKLVDQIRKNVDADQAQQQENLQKAQQERTDPLTQVKVEKERMGMQTKWQKHQQQMAIKGQQAMQQQQMASQQMALADAETAAKIQREQMAAEAAANQPTND